MKINENSNNSPSSRVLTKNRVTKREVKYNIVDKKNNQENSGNTTQNNIVYKREYKYKYSNRENNNNNTTKQEDRYKRSPLSYKNTDSKIDDKNIKNRKENKIDITFNFNLTNFNCNDSNKNNSKNKKLIEDYSEKSNNNNNNNNFPHSRKLSEYYTKIKPMNSNSILNIKVNTKNNSASKDNNNLNNNNRVVSTNGNANRNNKSNIIYCSYKNLCSYEKINSNITTSDTKLTNKIPIFEKKNYLSKNNTEKCLFDKNKKEENENYDKTNNLTHCSSKIFTTSKTNFTPSSSNTKKMVSKIKPNQEDKGDKNYSNRPIYKSKCKSSFNSKSVRMQTENNLLENPEINFFNIVKLIQASKENVD